MNFNWFLKVGSDLINIAIVVIKSLMPKTPPTASPETTTAPLPPEPPLPTSDLWDTPKNARHSACVIMDEMGITYDKIWVGFKRYSAKDVICAYLMQESGFCPRAIGKPNSNGTRDYGLAQFNNGKNPRTGAYYWIGPGAAFSSVEEVLSNPGKNVRIMVKCYQRGQLRFWASYTTGAFKRYLPQ